MLTECAIKARARRVSSFETIESGRVHSGMSAGGLRHHAGVANTENKSRHAQPMFASAY